MQTPRRMDMCQNPTVQALHRLSGLPLPGPAFCRPPYNEGRSNAAVICVEPEAERVITLWRTIHLLAGRYPLHLRPSTHLPGQAKGGGDGAMWHHQKIPRGYDQPFQKSRSQGNGAASASVLRVSSGGTGHLAMRTTQARGQTKLLGLLLRAEDTVGELRAELPVKHRELA